jgi:hypothetical protein
MCPERRVMKSALIAFSSLVLTVAAVSAQDEIDCGAAYKRSLEKLRQAQISAERLTAVSRRALRIYDACQTNDLRGAKSLFESLDRWKD